jgi:GTP:adenosylcobinamide-phosphate guanylyltransferase
LAKRADVFEYSNMPKLTAIILAGGARDEVCRDSPLAANKAFVEVGGSPLVTRVSRALREAENVGHIIVVAPDDAPSQPLLLCDERRTSGATITDSLRAGFADLPPDEPVLVAASDLPLLLPNATDEFILNAYITQGDLCYGYLERMAHEARYPTLAHTWARLRDGIFCGAGLSTIRPRALPALLKVLERLASARKAPWRLASLCGPRILFGYLLGTLSIADIEARASAMLGHKARGVLTLHPELAVNIDRYDDLVRVEQLIK